MNKTNRGGGAGGGGQNANNHTDHASASFDPMGTSSCNVATNESIKLVAESVGISNLNEDACKEVVNDLTFTIKSILLDAQKFARKSKRKKILPSDIDYSLKVRLMEVNPFIIRTKYPLKLNSVILV